MSEFYSYINISEEIPFPFTSADILSVGRYTKEINNNLYILDVVFDYVISRTWKQDEVIEYLSSENGLHKGWKYDLLNRNMANFVMKHINEIDPLKRSTHNVLRKIMENMSSENSEDGLIEGSWDKILYNDNEKHPTYWKSSAQIFDRYSKTQEPVRFGQCWCFAECLTSICKFLCIPVRTVYGKNTLIDTNLDNGIDFFEELRKDEDMNNFFLMKKDIIQSLLMGDEKSFLFDDLQIFNTGDSFWNIHYWNEVYLERDRSKGWEVIDSTPFIKSKTEPYMKFLGPCQVSTFKSNHKLDYDFHQFYSYTNSPFRLWATDSFIINDEIVNITYVYSLIFTNSEKESIYIKTRKIRALFNFTPEIQSKTQNLTENYKPFSLFDNYIKNKPKNGLYKIQCVYLNEIGNIVNVIQFSSEDITLFEEPVVNFSYYILSICLISLNDKSWFTYLKYF